MSELCKIGLWTEVHFVQPVMLLYDIRPGINGRNTNKRGCLDVFPME